VSRTATKKEELWEKMRYINDKFTGKYQPENLVVVEEKKFFSSKKDGGEWQAAIYKCLCSFW